MLLLHLWCASVNIRTICSLLCSFPFPCLFSLILAHMKSLQTAPKCLHAWYLFFCHWQLSNSSMSIWVPFVKQLMLKITTATFCHNKLQRFYKQHFIDERFWGVFYLFKSYNWVPAGDCWCKFVFSQFASSANWVLKATWRQQQQCTVAKWPNCIEAENPYTESL